MRSRNKLESRKGRRSMNRFDEVINRRQSGSIKYDFPKRFGKPADALPLWVADMDFRAPEKVMERLQEVAAYGIYGYSDAQEAYYNAVKSWFKNRFNWETEIEWIVKSPGVIFAISAAVRAFTKQGDAVMIQQPVYHPFVSCVVESGRRLINNELINCGGHYEMNLQDFEEKVIREQVKLFILCSPHNPVGRVWSREELSAVGAICEKHDVLVISDEIHCDFTRHGHVHTPFAAISHSLAEQAIICTSPSKTFNLAGLQVSNIFVQNPVLRRRLKREIYLTGYEEINIFALAGCQAAYEYGSTWLEELKVYLEGNTEIVRRSLQTELPQVKLIEPEGTYLLWLDCKGLGMQEDALGQWLDTKAKVWLNAGGGFGQQSGLYQRMNIACPGCVVQEAMDRLARAAREVTVQ